MNKMNDKNNQKLAGSTFYFDNYSEVTVFYKIDNSALLLVQAEPASSSCFLATISEVVRVPDICNNPLRPEAQTCLLRRTGSPPCCLKREGGGREETGIKNKA